MGALIVFTFGALVGAALAYFNHDKVKAYISNWTDKP